MTQSLYGATGTATIGAMLNDFLELPLQYNRLLRDTYIFRKTKDRKQNWRGGSYRVPFEGGEASNYQSGGTLVAQADIQSETLVKGTIPNYKEIHSAYIFHEKDFKQHGMGARVPRDTFLKMQIQNKAMKVRNRFAYMVNHSVLNGGAFATAVPVSTGTGAGLDVGNGNMTVDRPDKLVLGQKMKLKPSGESAVDGFVYSIDMNSGVCVFTKTRKSPGATLAATDYVYTNASRGDFATAADGSSATVRNVELFNPGDETASNRFSSLRSQILPGTVTGGSNSIFGITKTLYPFTQPIVSNATTTVTKAVDLVDDIFDYLVDFALKGQPMSATGLQQYKGETGNRTTKNMKMGLTIDCIMSYKWFAVFQKYYDRKLNGNWPKQKNVNFFDAMSFEMTAPDGLTLRLIAVEAMQDDMFYFLSDDCTQFATLNYIWQSMSPDGNKWFTVRDTTNGYSYICDFGLYGDFILKRPAGAGALNLGTLRPSAITGFGIS